MNQSDVTFFFGCFVRDSARGWELNQRWIDRGHASPEFIFAWRAFLSLGDD